MIQELDIQKLACLQDCSRHRRVIRAGRWISRGMVVTQDDSRCVIRDCSPEDFSHTHLAGVHRALIQLDQVHHPIAGVQVEHPQLFMIQPTDEATQDVKGILGRVDGRALGGMGVELGIELIMQLAQSGQGFCHDPLLAFLHLRINKAVQNQLRKLSW